MRNTIISLLLLSGLAGQSALADEVRLRDNAPDRHVVTKGDTLWDISGKFLKDPWKWPEIWKLNKDEIKDPHWIYPGDVIVLDRSGNSPQLKLIKGDGTPADRSTNRFAPRIRETPLAGTATPSIPAKAIEPFMARPSIIDPETYKSTARIALGPDEKVILGPGDKAYAVNLNAKQGEQLQIIRTSKPLYDPEDTDRRTILGYEAEYIGEAVVNDAGDVATLAITKAAKEASIGDRLVPTTRREYVNYVPHVPEKQVQARVAAVYGSVAYGDAGALATVVINKGKADGLELGHVLFTYKQGRPTRTEEDDKTLTTPPVKTGNLFIYKVFDKVAYGMLMDTTLPISVGDIARSN